MTDTLTRTRLHTGAAYEFIAAPGYTGQDGPWPAVIIVHGWESKVFSNKSYTEAARRLGLLGYHCLLLSLRGHEDARGDIHTVTRNDHINDLDAVFDYLVERPEVDMSRLGLVATSYGAYIACFTLLNKIKLLALRAPALYPNHLEKDDAGTLLPTMSLVKSPDLQRWRRDVPFPDSNWALKGLSRYKGKLLIAWSEKDEDLPFKVIESYVHAVGSDEGLQIIKGAGHVLNGEQREQYLDMLERFFKENYPVKNSTPTA